jgi:hypothetical protein
LLSALLPGLLPALLIVVACKPGPPGGQVVARVDGVDITRRDLLVEYTESGGAAAAASDPAGVERALLDRVIARKLLAAEARRRSIDRSPEFLGQEQRNRDMILGNQLTERMAGRMPPPTPDAVARYVASHADAFGARRLLTVGRITANAGADRAALVQLGNLDRIARYLTDRGQAFRRTTEVLDSMAAPDRAAALVRAAGHALVTVEGGYVVADQLLASMPQPIAPADRPRAAAAMLSATRYEALRRDTLATLRRNAAIEYAPPPGTKKD